MIERYTITKDQEQIEQRFNAHFPSSYKERFNAAPTQLLPIITSANPTLIKYFYWGTEPNLSKNNIIASKLINAPIEQLTEKHMYKNALKGRRCIVLADGLYVWKSISKKGQAPYLITLADKEPFIMAGLYETYENIDGVKVGTFSIITQAADSNMAKLTGEMPIILTSTQGQKWLNTTNTLEKSLEVLTNALPSEMVSYPVSPLVNNLANDSIILLNPAPPADQFGNYSLFD